MVSPDDLSCSENALLGLSEILDAFRQHNWSEAQAADVHYQRGLTYAVMARMDLALKEHRALKELNRTQAVSPPSADQPGIDGHPPAAGP